MKAAVRTLELLAPELVTGIFSSNFFIFLSIYKINILKPAFFVSSIPKRFSFFMSEAILLSVQKVEEVF